MIDRRLNYGRHLIERFARRAMPYQRVLDLGAGHGDDLMIAKKVNPNAELLAIENYPPYAKELTAKGVKVYEANLELDRLPFEDGSIDVIICNQILEHCKEIWWIFHEISRVLKNGGMILVGVPNLASLHNRFLLAIGRQPTAIQNNTAHVRGYTKFDFVKFINTGFPAGYELADYGGSNFYPFPSPIARPLAVIFPGAAWGLFMCLKKTGTYTGGFTRYPLEARLETNFFLG